MKKFGSILKLKDRLLVFSFLLCNLSACKSLQVDSITQRLGVAIPPTPVATATPSVNPTATPTATPRPSTSPTATPSATPVPPPTSAKYYLSPKNPAAGIPPGNDSNPGTIDKPFFSLEKLWKVVQPGDLVYLRGGVYQFPNQQYLVGKNGTATNPIRIWAYPGEKPILTRAATWTKGDNVPDGVSRWHRGGIVMFANYTHWKGLDISGFIQTDNTVESGFLALDSNDNIFEQLDVHHNGHGFYIEKNSSRNLVLNGDFHHNCDPVTGYGNADGLSIAYNTGVGNVIRGARAWWNCDDGIDTFEAQNHVQIESSWAWYNGYRPDTFTIAGNGVGIKLGSTFLSGSANRTKILRTVKNCVAFKNRDYGIHQNEGEFRSELMNNTLWDNKIGGLNFHYENLANIFTKNISFENDNTQVEISSNSTSSQNAAGAGTNDGGWPVKADASDFVSLQITGVDGPRGANGELPNIQLLKLKPTSDLIGLGAFP